MKYMALDQKGSCMAEYVWIDGTNGLRSKTKVRAWSITSCQHRFQLCCSRAAGTGETFVCFACRDGSGAAAYRAACPDKASHIPGLPHPSLEPAAPCEP